MGRKAVKMKSLFLSSHSGVKPVNPFHDTVRDHSEFLLWRQTPSKSSVEVPVEAMRQGLAAIPLKQVGSLSDLDALQQRFAVIRALHALPPAICTIGSVWYRMVF